MIDLIFFVDSNELVDSIHLIVLITIWVEKWADKVDEPIKEGENIIVRGKQNKMDHFRSRMAVKLIMLIKL